MTTPEPPPNQPYDQSYGAAGDQPYVEPPIPGMPYLAQPPVGLPYVAQPSMGEPHAEAAASTAQYPYQADPYQAAPQNQPLPYQQPYPQQPYPYGYPQYPQPHYLRAPSTNGMAIASMVLGILWVYWVGSILALIFGYVARDQIKKSGQQGDGMAIAGIVLGWVGVGILIVVLVFALAYTSPW